MCFRSVYLCACESFFSCFPFIDEIDSIRSVRYFAVPIGIQTLWSNVPINVNQNNLSTNIRRRVTGIQLNDGYCYIYIQTKLVTPIVSIFCIYLYCVLIVQVFSALNDYVSLFYFPFFLSICRHNLPSLVGT